MGLMELLENLQFFRENTQFLRESLDLMEKMNMLILKKMNYQTVINMYRK